MTGLLPRRAVLKAALGAAGYAALGAPFAQSAPNAA